MLTKKLPVYFLSLFIALLPLFNTSLTLDPVLTLRFLLLSILVSVLFLVNGGSLINKGVIKNPIIITLFSLFIFFSLSSFFSNYVISESIYHTLKIGVLLLLLFSLVYYMNNFRDLLLKSVVIFSLIASFLAISQYLSAYLNGWVFEEVNQIAGTMAHKNLLAS